MIKKLKHMYQFEPENKLSKISCRGEIGTGSRGSSLQIFFKIVVFKILQIPQEKTCVGNTF